MNGNKWTNMGDDILNSVLRAVDTGDFSGLSNTVGNAIDRALNGNWNGQNWNGQQGGTFTGGTYENTSEEYAFGGTYKDREKERTFEGTYENTAQTQYTKQTYRNPEKQQWKKQGSWSCYTNQNPNAGLLVSERKLPGKVLSPLFITFGIMGTAIFGISTLITSIIMLCIYPENLMGLAIATGVCGVLAASGITMITKGASISSRNKRFALYGRMAWEHGYCSICDLAEQVRKKPAFVIRDLQKMIQKGMFLQGHLDYEKTTFMLRNDIYQQYQNTRQTQLTQASEQKAETAKTEQHDNENMDNYSEEVKKILSEGETYIQHIHACNDAIPGEVMSEKLEVLEDVMRRIFAQLKKQPQQADELHKFMNYYLPTTTKLIDAYENLDGQPEYGQNIANTKKEIEDTLDTINTAFKNLFDSMFEDTAWDIASDISTMKTMLAQEGLTKNSDFETK